MRSVTAGRAAPSSRPERAGTASVLIHNVRVIGTASRVEPKWLLVDAGKIKEYGSGRCLPAAARRIDAQGCLLAAGLIDAHIHGAVARLRPLLPRQGTTAFVSSISSAAVEQMTAALCQDTNGSGGGARLLGFHLEGPFLSPAMAGAQDADTMIAPDRRVLEKLLSAGAGAVRMVTLCAAQPGAAAVISLLRQRHVVAAQGHSVADFAQAQAAIAAGATHATHWCNRMPPVSSRAPGLAMAFLDAPAATLEVIADGRHVHPALLRLIVRVKSPETVVLVSDAVNTLSGLRRQGSVFARPDGTLAGGGLPLLQSVKNMVHFTDISLAQAFAMASRNPARLLGVDRQIGSIERGMDADVLVCDADFRVRLCLVGGTVCYRRGIRKGETCAVS